MAIIEIPHKFTGKLSPRTSTKRVIIHHSAGADVPSSTIHSWHLNQGWLGIGYHFVIRKNGDIETGRPMWSLGSHAGPKGNPDSIGICLTGNFEVSPPAKKQLDSLVWLIKTVIEPEYGELSIIGHRHVMSTACPGRLFPWAYLKERLEEFEVIYKTMKDVPDWGRELTEKLVEGKIIQGDGQGNINLPESTLKTMVYLNRMGVLKGWKM